jgi:hypothetical protein
MKIDFNELLSQLKNEITGLAKHEFKDFAVEAASDGTSLLHTTEAKRKNIQNNLQKVK